MATANIKITALSDITSANMTYQDLLAVVDMNGTPETKKSTVQLVGNLILDGAGGSYFPAAAQAVLAQSVTNAAQPNITSTGTLTSLAVTGNVVAGNMQTGAMTATYFVGDGANLTNVPAGIPSGDGGNLSNLAGANVTGEVPFAAVANSVAVANVSGLGNIATVNLDGNASNILHGDGTWSADATDYSNANVVSLLAAFGSNTISTTGLITGDGGGLSNVPYANVTGTPTLGNISTIDIDGNSANYLDGTGTWGPLTVSLTGDAGNLSNIVGANVTGEVSFAATANAVAGANVSGEVGFAAVANSVALANVSGAGNIAGTNYDGNASNVLHGDGTWSADATDYSNANVVSLLAAFGSNTITTTGNVSGGNFLTSGEANIYSLFVDAGGANIQGSVEINGSIANVAYVNASGNIDANNFIALSNFDGLNLNVTGTATAGQFIGDGGNLSNLQYSNIAGTPTLGNISTIDIDGSASNVLYGNGVFAPASSPALTGDGYQLSNLTGANVSGEVSFAATANAVALANVSGAGNIASIDIDGSASNVLYGNGVFAAAPGGGSYGDSNVVTLLGSFGSNTITTTGLITGDGGGLSNIAGANVTGTINTAVLAQEVINSSQPNIGSVGTLSELLVSNTIVSVGLTANTGNVTVSTGQFVGDGGSISNVVGANVTGEVGFSAVANSVALANVSGAGNIASINLDGNVSNVLRGDGTFAADANSSYGDSNVASLLASFGGNAISTTANISAGNINANTNGFSLGYLEIPQVSLTADDTIALEDSGKHFHSNTAGNITLTIPTNATVAFPVGTAISIVEEAAGNILVNAAAGVNLYLAGNSTAGNRVLATYGMATIMKTGTDTWFINGTGVS